MVDEDLLEAIERLGSQRFAGEVFRHTLGQRPPDAENTGGARWNPSGTAAIYTALRRETAIAEGDHLLSLQTPRPRVRRVIHRIRVELERVLDLRSLELLATLGVDDAALRSDDHWHCRRIGEAVVHLGNDGMLVPSARDAGGNLIVFPANPRSFTFEVLESKEIKDPESS